MDILKALVRRGADVGVCSSTGVSPQHSATESNKLDMMRLFLLDEGAYADARGSCKPILDAVQRVSVETGCVLPQHGADPSATTDDVDTPLCLAILDPNAATSSKRCWGTEHL